MVKFFERQKVDQVGITAVTLQKILLFLMILSLLSFLNGGFLSFLLCLLGFVGAYRRNTGLLRAYFIISVTLIVLAFVLVVISSFSAWNNINYDTTDSSSGYPNSGLDSSNANTNVPVDSASVSSSESSSASSSESSSQSSSSWSESSSAVIYYFSSSSSSSSGSYYEDNYTAFVFLALLVMVWVFFLVYLKVYSLVLANRLRKMILLAASELPTTTPTATTSTKTSKAQVHEFAPANTSCAVPQAETPAPASPQMPAAPFHPAMFSPGFAPYYMPQGMMPYGQMPYGQGMQYGQMPQVPQMPQHVFFGQQPVFYSYAPAMPQSPNTDENVEEKL